MEPHAPGIAVVPVRTPTLPPATHTNTYVVGTGALSVFDPASPWEDQQAMLARRLAERLDRGERVERIVLTHHHPDHVGGALALQAWLGARGLEVPIAAHRANRALLGDRVPLQQEIADGQILPCGDRELIAHHTPGHAPGHLVFQDRGSGAVIAGDMVAGVGTIAIAPEDGHLGQYLDSLERLRALEPAVLLPAHGDPLVQAESVLSFYIAHRHARTEQVRDALDRLGRATPLEIAARVYARELDPRYFPLAAVQVHSHLIWLAEQGLADREGEAWRLAS